MIKLTVGSSAPAAARDPRRPDLRPRLPLPAARPADRPDALPAVRCRSRHQPVGQLRADHAGGRRGVRGDRGGLKQSSTIIPATAAAGPVIFAAALATMLVNPIQERITRWSENRFQKQLVILRDDFPMRPRPARDRLARAKCWTKCSRGSSGRPDHAQRRDRRRARAHDARTVDPRGRGMAEDQAEQDYTDDICDPTDRLFPIRVPLCRAQATRSRSANPGRPAAGRLGVQQGRAEGAGRSRRSDRAGGPDGDQARGP